MMKDQLLKGSRLRLKRPNNILISNGDKSAFIHKTDSSFKTDLTKKRPQGKSRYNYIRLSGIGYKHHYLNKDDIRYYFYKLGLSHNVNLAFMPNMRIIKEKGNKSVEYIFNAKSWKLNENVLKRLINYRPLKFDKGYKLKKWI